MKITGLLKLMNESDVYPSDTHYFKIFSDGAGSIKEDDDDDATVVWWDDEKEMQKELNKIYSKLKQDNIKFEL